MQKNNTLKWFISSLFLLAVIILPKFSYASTEYIQRYYGATGGNAGVGAYQDYPQATSTYASVSGSNSDNPNYFFVVNNPIDRIEMPLISGGCASIDTYFIINVLGTFDGHPNITYNISGGTQYGDICRYSLLGTTTIYATARIHNFGQDGSHGFILNGSALNGGFIFDTSDEVSYYEGGWAVQFCSGECTESFSNVGEDIDVTGTKITSITPYDEQVIATSTSHTIGATGHLNAEDLNDYSALRIHIENSAVSYQQCADAFCATLANGALQRDFYYSLITATGFAYSSTTQGLPIGKYYVTTQIEKGDYCILGFCLSTVTVISTSTTFTVATTTKADKLKDSAKEYLDSLTSTNTNAFENCTIANFDLFLCGTDLITWSFVPTPDTISTNVELLRNDFINRVPIGYLTRTVNLFSATTTLALPAFNVPIRTGESTTTDTMYIGFDMNDIVTGAGSQLDDIRDPYFNKNLRDIFEPIVQLIVAFAVLLVIIKDVTGSHRHEHDVARRT